MEGQCTLALMHARNIHTCRNKRKKEQMNKGKNKQRKEQTNKQTKEWTNK